MQQSTGPATVIVIGGGAAGMVAAIAAARRGAAVTVLERLPRVGKKLLATGNGRCNFANAHLDPRRYHGTNPGFAGAALAAFDLEMTLAFFRELGVQPREEEAGKIFPRSGQAAAVLDLLRHELARRGVETRCESEVTRLVPRRGGWDVATREETRRCGAVVLASGGRASPQLGSNGSGYALVRPLGHRLIPPFPALTRIRVASPFLKHLKGVKIEGVATLVPQGPDGDRGEPTPDDRENTAAGEILFTETGLSGPPILDLSRRAGERAQRGDGTFVQLDLCPEFAADVLAMILRGRFSGRHVTGGDQPRPYEGTRLPGAGVPPDDGSRLAGNELPPEDGSRFVGERLPPNARLRQSPRGDLSHEVGQAFLPVHTGGNCFCTGRNACATKGDAPQQRQSRENDGALPPNAVDVRVPVRPELVEGRAETSAELALVGFLNKRLIVPVLKVAGIPDPNRPAASLGKQEILAVAAVLKGWRFAVTGTDSWTDAQVTAGGIDVADVFPETLESRLAPGLFFAGEVLDIDGDCGGFNLQWAWSSGHLAGTGAARRAVGSGEHAQVGTPENAVVQDNRT